MWAALWLPLISAQNVVLVRFLDRNCLQMDVGEGVQQSWSLRASQNDICYDVGVGMQCNFRCNLKLTCEYASGSGVIIESFLGADCTGTRRSKEPLARHLTWLQARDFFQGSCTPAGHRKRLRNPTQKRSMGRRWQVPGLQ